MTTSSEAVETPSAPPNVSPDAAERAEALATREQARVPSIARRVDLDDWFSGRVAISAGRLLNKIARATRDIRL